SSAADGASGSHHADADARPGVLGPAVGAIGIVFGDTGPTPLYAFKEPFGGTHHVSLTHDNVLGVLSLMVWSLFLIVTVKYVAFMMRADNRGEGGIMARMALVRRTLEPRRRNTWVLVTLGMFGAALFYGDG